MAMHSRKLLLLGALCWVAPLSAQQRPVAPEQAKAHPKGCHYAEARAQALQSSGAKPATVILVSSGGTLGGDPMLGAARRAFQP